MDDEDVMNLLIRGWALLVAGLVNADAWVEPAQVIEESKQYEDYMKEAVAVTKQA